MEFPSWATPGANRKLYGKAKANGADELTLSDFDATTGFLDGKSVSIQPPRPPPALSKEDVAEVVDKMLFVRTGEVSMFLTSKSRSQIYQKIASSPHFSLGYDIEKDMEKVRGSLPTVPPATDSLFTIVKAAERSKRLEGGEIKKGTQEIFRDAVQLWNPRGRTMDASSQDTPNLGSNKMDARLLAPGQTGECAIILGGEIKKMPDAGKPEGGFSSEDRGQTLEFGTKVMKYQAWRKYLHMFLTDTRRFEFFRITRLENGNFHYDQTPTYTDRKGWLILSQLCAQTDSKLGYVSLAVEGWALGATLGVGRTAVVVEASSSGVTNAVVKVYTEAARLAVLRRQSEYDVLQALAAANVPLIPKVVPGSPAVTATKVPVLFKTPRGYPAGSNHIFPTVVDFIPLVDTLNKVHQAGFCHNDIAPENIFFLPGLPPQVFLNDFGGATRITDEPALVCSRKLYYFTTDEEVAVGTKEDLRALVLSLFVLTVRHGFDPVTVTTAAALSAVVRDLFPWCDALTAAEEGDHDGVKAALEWFRPRK